MNVGPAFVDDLIELLRCFCVGRSARDVPVTDWPTLLQVAGRERLLPLLYSLLRGREDVPAAVPEALRRGYYQTAARNSALLEEAGRAVDLLLAAGVPVCLLKGLYLVTHGYGNVALRPMGDADLLVPPGQLAEAARRLQEAGYRVAEGPLSELRPGFRAAFGFEVGLRWEREGPLVELHEHLFESPYLRRRLAVGGVWERTRPLEWEGRPVRALSPEDQLLHVTAHAWGEASPLLRLVDVVLLLRDEPVDWGTLVERARAAGLLLPVAEVLRAAEPLGVAVPRQVRALLSERRPRWESWAARQSLRLGREAAVSAGLLLDLWGIGGRPMRLRYLVAKLFPGSRFMEERYSIPHRAVLPFFYLYRLGKGAVDLLTVFVPGRFSFSRKSAHRGR